jgi:hypothetical protein
LLETRAWILLPCVPSGSIVKASSLNSFIPCFGAGAFKQSHLIQDDASGAAECLRKFCNGCDKYR